MTNGPFQIRIWNFAWTWICTKCCL